MHQETTLGGADAQTGFETASKKSRDPPLSEVNTSRSREDRMEHPDDLKDFVPPTPYDLPLSKGHTPRNKGCDEKGGSTADQISTARPEVCAASVLVNVSAATPSAPPIGTTIFGDEDLTIAQTLINLRCEKAKEELAGLDKAQKEKQKQEEATSADLTKEFDEIQARIDADHELTVRMTHKEQEKYTIKERARLLAEYFKRRKKQLAEESIEVIRNKPPPRTQVRNRMITYLKHIGKYIHQQLKHKTLEELQKLYQKEQKWMNDFVPIDFEKEEKKSVEPESKGKKGKIIERVVDSALKQKYSKKQKMMQE
nr:hypothetical protein [Tanacetum cinerariifolium]